MCYSAIVKANYREFCRMFGATLSIREFVELYVERSTDSSVIMPKAMSDSFLDSPDSPEEQQIVELISAFNALRRTAEEEELFKQMTRLNKAEAALKVKQTKAASENQRIATKLIKAAQARLDDLRRTAPKPRDNRIFPNWYAPVLIVEDGQLVVKPMRYRCRPNGLPESFDEQYPGCYNARRSSLCSNFWKPLFGHKHGLVLVDLFYEKVLLNRLEGRELRPGEPPSLSCRRHKGRGVLHRRYRLAPGGVRTLAYPGPAAAGGGGAALRCLPRPFGHCARRSRSRQCRGQDESPAGAHPVPPA
jgi:hypothetical protein